MTDVRQASYEEAHQPQAREVGRAEPKEAGEAPKQKQEAETRHRRRPWIFTIGAIVLALLGAAGVYYWLSTHGVVSTDDAFTDGRAITIAPQVAGNVVSLDVTDNEFVHTGQALIHIDPRQYANDQLTAKGVLGTAKAQLGGFSYGAEIARKNFPARLMQAQAQLASAQATEIRAQADYQRQRSLPKQATTQQDVDAATANYQQAQAAVKQAEAQVLEAEPVPQQIGQADKQVSQQKGQIDQAQGRLDQADLNLQWTTVLAPQDGWVTRRNVEMGDYVTAGQQIMSIVAPEVWVTANFKETELYKIKPGQPVKIHVDAYPNLQLKGHVDSIQKGSGSKFTAFPPENATGNFVKIVQRVPVKIVIDSGLDPNTPLPLGLSVEPTVTVK